MRDDYVAKNLVELHIYLESNSIQQIIEEPDYEFSQLLSDLGGVIGLYLGMAVVSALELVESCFLFGLLAYRSVFSASKVSRISFSFLMKSQS
jgi:hypothetical protein